jgi:hypothetical protein
MNTQISNTNVIASLFSRGRLFFLLLGVWTLLAHSHCCAQGTLYTDRSIFNATLQSSTTITFTGLPDPPPGLGRPSVTVSGVTFTNFEGQLFTGTGVLANFDSSYPVGVFLPGGRNAFSADFSGGIDPANNPFNATITVNLVGGQTFTHNFTGQFGSWTFVGMVFPQAISSLIYNDGAQSNPFGNHEEMLDNVTFGVAVPEPQTSLLVVFGILTSFGVLRLRTRK